MVNCLCRGGGPARTNSVRQVRQVRHNTHPCGRAAGLGGGATILSQWSTWPLYVRSVWLVGDPGPDINGEVVIYAGAK